jgi:hypothetical protein
MATIPTRHPPVELTATGERPLGRCKKQPIFGFRRAILHELFEDAFQCELTGMYERGARGRPGAARDARDGHHPSGRPSAFRPRRCHRRRHRRRHRARLAARARPLGAPEEDDPPFSQNALFEFRMRLIAHDTDRRPVERTLELAARFERLFDEMAREAGIRLLEGYSMTAAQDVDRTDLSAAHEALQRLVGQVGALSTFIATHLAEECAQPPLAHSLRPLHARILYLPRRGIDEYTTIRSLSRAASTHCNNRLRLRPSRGGACPCGGPEPCQRGPAHVPSGVMGLSSCARKPRTSCRKLCMPW